MLAGIIITLAFIMTSMTLSQVASLERETAAQRPSPLAGEWRFLHERIGSALDVAVDESTTVGHFEETTMPRIISTFRSVQEEKGYDVIIRLVDGSASFDKSEADLIDGGNYDAWTADGRTHFDHAYDATPDGILVHPTCPLDGGIPCIVGIYLYIRIQSPDAMIEEYILFAVNQP